MDVDVVAAGDMAVAQSRTDTVDVLREHKTATQAVEQEDHHAAVAVHRNTPTAPAATTDGEAVSEPANARVLADGDAIGSANYGDDDADDDDGFVATMVSRRFLDVQDGEARNVVGRDTAAAGDGALLRVPPDSAATVLTTAATAPAATEHAAPTDAAASPPPRQRGHKTHSKMSHDAEDADHPVHRRHKRRSSAHRRVGSDEHHGSGHALPASDATVDVTAAPELASIIVTSATPTPPRRHQPASDGVDAQHDHLHANAAKALATADTHSSRGNSNARGDYGLTGLAPIRLPISGQAHASASSSPRSSSPLSSVPPINAVDEEEDGAIQGGRRTAVEMESVDRSPPVRRDSVERPGTPPASLLARRASLTAAHAADAERQRRKGESDRRAGHSRDGSGDNSGSESGSGRRGSAAMDAGASAAASRAVAAGDTGNPGGGGPGKDVEYLQTAGAVETADPTVREIFRTTKATWSLQRAVLFGLFLVLAVYDIVTDILVFTSTYAYSVALDLRLNNYSATILAAAGTSFTNASNLFASGCTPAMFQSSDPATYVCYLAEQTCVQTIVEDFYANVSAPIQPLHDDPDFWIAMDANTGGQCFYSSLFTAMTFEEQVSGLRATMWVCLAFVILSFVTMVMSIINNWRTRYHGPSKLVYDYGQFLVEDLPQLAIQLTLFAYRSNISCLLCVIDTGCQGTCATNGEINAASTFSGVYNSQMAVDAIGSILGDPIVLLYMSLAAIALSSIRLAVRSLMFSKSAWIILDLILFPFILGVFWIPMTWALYASVLPALGLAFSTLRTAVFILALVFTIISPVVLTLIVINVRTKLIASYRSAVASAATSYTYHVTCLAVGPRMGGSPGAGTVRVCANVEEGGGPDVGSPAHVAGTQWQMSTISRRQRENRATTSSSHSSLSVTPTSPNRAGHTGARGSRDETNPSSGSVAPPHRAVENLRYSMDAPRLSIDSSGRGSSDRDASAAAIGNRDNSTSTSSGAALIARSESPRPSAGAAAGTRRASNASAVSAGRQGGPGGGSHSGSPILPSMMVSASGMDTHLTSGRASMDAGYSGNERRSSRASSDMRNDYLVASHGAAGHVTVEPSSSSGNFLAVPAGGQAGQEQGNRRDSFTRPRRPSMHAPPAGRSSPPSYYDNGGYV